MPLTNKPGVTPPARANNHSLSLSSLEEPNSWIKENNPTGSGRASDWHIIESAGAFLQTEAAKKQPFFLCERLWRNRHCRPVGGKAAPTPLCSVPALCTDASIVNPHPPYYSNSTWYQQVSVRASSFEMQKCTLCALRTRPRPPSCPPPHPFKVNDTALNASIAELRATWPEEPAWHPADVYQTLSEGVDPRFDADLTYRLARAYFGMCAETDRMMGDLLNVLREQGLEDDTVIFFVADHGELYVWGEGKGGRETQDGRSSPRHTSLRRM